VAVDLAFWTLGLSAAVLPAVTLTGANSARLRAEETAVACRLPIVSGANARVTVAVPVMLAFMMAGQADSDFDWMSAVTRSVMSARSVAYAFQPPRYCAARYVWPV